MFSLTESGKIIRFLDRFEDYTDSIDETSIPTIIAALMDLGDLFPEGNARLFASSTSLRILRIVHQLSHRFDNQIKRFEILKAAIHDTLHSINTIVEEISRLDGEQGRFHGEPDPEEKWTVNKEQLEELEQLASSKIKDWAQEGRLQDNSKLTNVLYRWREWGDPREISQFIENTTKTDEGLVNLIALFLVKVYTNTMGDYVDRITWKIDLKDVANFMELSEVEPRLRRISSSGDFNNLKESQQNAVNIFLDTIDGKMPRY